MLERANTNRCQYISNTILLSLDVVSASGSLAVMYYFNADLSKFQIVYACVGVIGGAALSAVGLYNLGEGGFFRPAHAPALEMRVVAAPQP